MKLYLTLGAVPELAPLPTHERRIVYHACRKQVAGAWQIWAGGILGFLIGAGAGLGLLLLIVRVWMPFDILVNFFLGGVPWGALIVGGVEFGRTIGSLSVIGPHVSAFLEAAQINVDSEAPKKIEIDYLRDPFEESKARAEGDSEAT